MKANSKLVKTFYLDRLETGLGSWYSMRPFGILICGRSVRARLKTNPKRISIRVSFAGIPWKGAQHGTIHFSGFGRVVKLRDEYLAHNARTILSRVAANILKIGPSTNCTVTFYYQVKAAR